MIRKTSYAEYLHLFCDCGDAVEHTVVFYKENDDEDGQVMIMTSMNPFLPWHKRLWRGIQYIFNFGDNRDHQWVEMWINKEKQEELVKWLNVK